MRECGRVNCIRWKVIVQPEQPKIFLHPLLYRLLVIIRVKTLQDFHHLCKDRLIFLTEVSAESQHVRFGYFALTDDIRRQFGCGLLVRSLLLRFSLAVGFVAACIVLIVGL